MLTLLVLLMLLIPGTPAVAYYHLMRDPTILEIHRV
jgi:hypothetical protein